MAKIVIKVDQKVTWKDSSEVIHNVLDDAGKAINKADVHVPEGGKMCIRDRVFSVAKPRSRGRRSAADRARERSILVPGGELG